MTKNLSWDVRPTKKPMMLKRCKTKQIPSNGRSETSRTYPSLSRNNMPKNRGTLEFRRKGGFVRLVSFLLNASFTISQALATSLQIAIIKLLECSSNWNSMPKQESATSKLRNTMRLPKCSKKVKWCQELSNATRLHSHGKCFFIVWAEARTSSRKRKEKLSSTNMYQ